MPKRKVNLMRAARASWSRIALAAFALSCAATTVEAQIYDYGVHAPTVPGCAAPKGWVKTGAYYTCQAPTPPPPPPGGGGTPSTPFAVCAAALQARGYVLRSSPWVISAHPRDVTYWQGIADNSAATAMGTYFDVGCQILDSSGGMTGLQIFAHCVTGCGSDGGG